MKTAVIILKSGLIFGAPEKIFALPGYRCCFQADNFAKATCLTTNRDHFICDTGDHFDLWPIKYDGVKTEKNPLGEYVESGDPIRIPKSKPVTK